MKTSTASGGTEILESALSRLDNSTRTLLKTGQFEAAKDVYIAAGKIHDLQIDRPNFHSQIIIDAFDHALKALEALRTVAFRREDFVNNISRWRRLAQSRNG